MHVMVVKERQRPPKRVQTLAPYVRKRPDAPNPSMPRHTVAPASTAVLAAERAATSARSRRFILGAGAVAAALSVFVCTMLNFQLQDLLRQLNPPLFRTLAHAFDEPAWQIVVRLLPEAARSLRAAFLYVPCTISNAP